MDHLSRQLPHYSGLTPDQIIELICYRLNLKGKTDAATIVRNHYYKPV